MATAPAITRRHPVVRAVGLVEQELEAVADAGVWTLNSSEAASALRDLAHVRARLAELELRVLRHAERIGLHSETGAADTMAWWANTTRQTRPVARRRLTLAAALDFDHEPVRDAMAGGSVSEEQALVIVRAVEALPSDIVAIDVRVEAERRLIAFAAEHDAKALTVLGRRILDIVAPEVGEEHELRQLEREQAVAEDACRLTLTDDGHGRCHLRGCVPTTVGAMLRKALLALAAPRHRASQGPLGDRVAGPTRLGRALCAYVERYPAERVPDAGGVSATVVVTMTLEALLGADRVATLDTGERITAGEARRLACEAGLVPAVLGGASQVLDLGRTRRFHTGRQRIAIALRDRTCTAEGCDWPPAMCHVHHDVPWSRGGPTDVETGRLLCPRHHAMAHDPRHELRAVKNGRVVFSRT